MKKRSIFIVALNLLSLLVFAQSNIRLNNYWGSAQYINPAFIYDKYEAVFSMAARKQWLGISSLNLFSAFDNSHKYQTNTNFIYGRYRQMSNDVLNLGFGLCGIQYSNMYQAEFNMTGYFKASRRSGLEETPDLFDVGLFVRTGTEVGLIFGFDLSKSIHLYYSYDYNLTGINQKSVGTNEIILTYNLTKKAVCHNCWY
jgi:hypothetical protein